MAGQCIFPSGNLQEVAPVIQARPVVLLIYLKAV